MDTYTVKTVAAESQLFSKLTASIINIETLLYRFKSYVPHYDEASNNICKLLERVDDIRHFYDEHTFFKPSDNTWLVQFAEIVDNLSSDEYFIDNPIVKTLLFIADKSYDQVHDEYISACEDDWNDALQWQSDYTNGFYQW